MSTDLLRQNELRLLLDDIGADVATAEQARGEFARTATFATAATTQSSRRHQLLATAAVAATVVAAIAVPTAVHNSARKPLASGATPTTHSKPTGHTLPVTGRANLRQPTTVTLPAGWEYQSQATIGLETVKTKVKGTAADVVIEQSKNKNDGWQITTYSSGMFTPDARYYTHRVVVTGQTLYTNPVAGKYSSWAWPLTHDRWVTLTPKNAANADQVALVVRNVHPNVPMDLQLPLRLGYFPPGYVALTGSYLAHGPGSGVPNTSTTLNKVGNRSIVAVLTTSTGNGATLGAGMPLVVNGQVARYLPGDTRPPAKGVLAPPWPSLRLRYDDLVIGISGPFTEATLIKIANSITLASNPHNMKTWFDATK